MSQDDSQMGSQASAGGMVVPYSQGDGRFAPVNTWRAVLVKHQYRVRDSDLNPRVKDHELGVQLHPGERGVSVATKIVQGGTLHRVHFERRDIGFYGKFLA
jgi:hypothetical protein